MRISAGRMCHDDGAGSFALRIRILAVTGEGVAAESSGSIWRRFVRYSNNHCRKYAENGNDWSHLKTFYLLDVNLFTGISFPGDKIRLHGSSSQQRKEVLGNYT